MMNVTKMLRKAVCLVLVLSMLLSVGACAFATPKAETKVKEGAVNGVDYGSTKTLKTGTQGDDKFTLEIDAFQKGSVETVITNVPLDVTIVMDRSQSMSQPASTSAADYKSFKSYYPGAILYKDPTWGWYTFDHEDIVESTSIKNEIAKINAYLDTLDENAYEGYYRATNYLKRGVPYFVNNHVGFAGEGFASWEPLRYNKTTKQWEMRVTNGLWGGDFPAGINTMDYKGGDIRPKEYEWMSVAEAYKEYCARNRRNIYTGKQVKPGSNGETTGYTGYYDFVIATPRLTKAIDATENFIRNVYASSKTLPEGMSHRVSILSFGTGAFYNGGKYAYNTYDAVNDTAIKVESTLTYDLGVSKTITNLNTDANLNSLLTVLRSHYTYTNTRTDWALEAVESNPDFLPDNDKGDRKQVVVLITDGAPTYADNMQADVANTALVAGKKLKGENVGIYTIGFMPDLDDSKAVADFNSSNPGSPDNANSFLRLLSSYYPDSESVTNTEGYTMAETENPFYKADDGTGEKLKEIYDAMQAYIIETEYERVFSEADSLLLFDEITREFKLDSAGKIQVYALPYLGNNKFGTAELIGTHDVSQPTASSPVSISGQGYNIALTKNGELTDVTLNWLDSKYAFARETAHDTGGTYGSTYLMGYKILLKLPLVVNRDNTMGGNNINTNTASSGFYLSPDAGDSNALGELIHGYPVPNANVSFNISAKVYDYFVDLTDYIEKLQNATPGSTEAQKIFEAMYSGINDYLSLLQNHKNDYLKFDMSLYNSLKQLLDGWYANAGATSFSASAPASGASFDFLKDQVLSFVLSLIPLTSNNDSCADVVGGVAPFNPVKLELSPNYYGPKYVVVDFDEVVKTPLDKESGLNPALQSGQKNGKIESGNICFDFRASYGTGNKSFLQGDYTTVKYQVTPINATKTQGTATTVARNFYVIPANVMTYDDTMLTFSSGVWETMGTYSDSVQSHDNSVTHGYDSIYNSTYSASYYHNAQKGVTVSNTNGTAQASFTILGTGFDIYSMTSPDSGMMAVEVSTDSAFKNDIRTFLVDTYLEGQTLYQIPVVRCDDLEYGTYYIRITAFYDSIFDHNYISPWKNGVVTEEKLRERYGIAEDVDFTFIPSASGYDQPATRIADAKHGQYNVYVDGIRVYNTLGTVSANAIADFAYQEAGEGKANIININDALVDADNADSWKQGTTVNGVLYMAAGKTTAEQGDQSKGIILGMEGALYTKASGAKFYVYKDAALAEPVTYKGSNVYYRKTTTTAPDGREFSGLNFYYDGGSAADPMTRAEVVEAFGSIPTYYNSNYSAMGPEKEIYLNGSNGVAFKVGTGASKVMLSLKSHDGAKATVQIYDGSKFVTLAATTSRVEMYYDITKYINSDGYVFVKNGGGISAICNLKIIGTATKSITIDAGLAAEAARVFKYAGLPVEESAQIMHSLDLQSDITLNYVVKTELLAEYDNSYLEVEFDGINYSLAPEVRGNLAYFTMEGITAVEMTEELRATLHLFMGEEEFVSETDVYCVADYAYAQLNKAEASAELKAVCANLLRYGAEAQSYKSYNTDKPADAALTEEQKSYLSDLNTLVLENKAQALADGEAIWKGKTLVLDTKVTLKAVFDLSGFEGDMSALNLRVSYTDCAGEQITLSLTDVQVYNAEKALYSFDLDTLDAADLRSILTMALYEGDAQLSETQLYSVESYCATKTAALGDLCKALMAYSDSAKAYFAN